MTVFKVIASLNKVNRLALLADFCIFFYTIQDNEEMSTEYTKNLLKAKKCMGRIEQVIKYIKRDPAKNRCVYSIAVKN